jgi:hypothetical protein
MANSKVSGGPCDRSVTLCSCHEDIAFPSTGDKEKMTERESTHERKAGYDRLEDLTGLQSAWSKHDSFSSSEESDFEEDERSQMSNDIDQNRHVKKQKFINKAVEDEMEIRSLRKMIKALRKVAAIREEDSVGGATTKSATAIPTITHNENSGEKGGLKRPNAESSSMRQGVSRALHKQQTMQQLFSQCRDHYGPRPQDFEAARAMQEDYEHPVVALSALNASVAFLPRPHNRAEEADRVAISESEEGDNEELNAAQLMINKNVSSVSFPLPARLEERPVSPCESGPCGTCSTCSASVSSLLCVVSSNCKHPEHEHSMLDVEASLRETKISAMIEGVPSLSLDEALELSATPR